DGSTDEDFVDLGTTCDVGVGACETQGTFVCSADGSGTECDGVAGTPALLDSCDGLDDDCDGVVDATVFNGQAIGWCTDGDNDGIIDGTEVFVDGTDPNNPDTDGDGIQDGTELGLTVPELPGATDTSVFVPDSDPATTTDPLDDDTDDDG